MLDCEILIEWEIAEILKVATGSLHFSCMFRIAHPERDLMALTELYGKRCTPRACSENGYFFQHKRLSALASTCFWTCTAMAKLSQTPDGIGLNVSRQAITMFDFGPAPSCGLDIIQHHIFLQL